MKREIEGRWKIIFLLFIMFFLNGRKIVAANNIENSKPSFYQNYMETLKNESEPYEYIYLYDQKEMLYDKMKEEEWASYLNSLKYFMLDYLANMPEEFRTEGEIHEVITLYRGTREYLIETNKQKIHPKEDFEMIAHYAQPLFYTENGEKKKVTDFTSFENYLQTRLSVDVKKCLDLLTNIDRSENKEMLTQAAEEAENYLKQIATPNGSISKKYIDQLFQLKSVALQDLLPKNNESDYGKRKLQAKAHGNSEQVFAYGMRGDIATITVTEYYKGGGWKIHDQWSEGYLVTGKEGVVLGNEEPIFCADPNKMFRKGYYSKKKYPFPEHVTKIIVAALHRQRQIEEYSWLTKDYQYIAQQCMIWNIENEYKRWIVPDRKDSRLRLEFGNGVHFPKPHQNVYIAEKVFKLVDECIAWGKENYKYFSDARADYYVREDANQPIVRFYGTYIPCGFASIKKSSSHPELTVGNECYHLEAAEYGIYDNKECTKKIETLRTDAQGTSNKVELLPGQYWIKEIKAPKGFHLDSTVYPISITSNQTKELQLSDIPYRIPCDILIEKVDQDTDQNHPQGNATLEKAHFKVKFYAGIWKKGEDPDLLGKTPTRTWIFQTNKEGIIRYEEEAKISGDPLYTDTDGTPMLPIGTITIQEVKAPEGYQINPTIYIVQLQNDGGNAPPPICQKTVVPETLLKLDIQKILKGTKLPIENVMFTHIRPNGTKEISLTNHKGEASFLGLEYGKHVIMETKAPEGYAVLPEEITIHVDEKNQMILETPSSSTPLEHISFSIQANGNGLLCVENQYIDYSLQIQKKSETDKLLEGAEFTIYGDEKCTQIVEKRRTNKDGIALFEKLKVDKTYYLKETDAPKGYEIPRNKDGSEIIYKIKSIYNTQHHKLEYYINDKKQKSDQILGDAKYPILSFTVINYSGKKLPETGNSRRLAIFLISIASFIYVVFQKKQSK